MVDSISNETVRRVVDKTTLNPKPWQNKHWCSAQVTADVVWRMEDVLDSYTAPDDPKCPVVWLDERPVQVRSDVRESLPMEPGQPRRVDYDYERNGTCTLVLVFQP